MGVFDAGLAEFEANFFSSLTFTDIEADKFAVGGSNSDLTVDDCDLVRNPRECGKDFKADTADNVLVLFGDPEGIGGLEVSCEAVEISVIAIGVPAEVEFLVDGLDEADDLRLVLGFGGSYLGHWSEFILGLGSRLGIFLSLAWVVSSVGRAADS